jgi:Phosphatidylserine/phosphatidylglycerophosphate/cardiolipin synthases and related enzymes
MNTDFGNDRSILLAISDIVTKHKIISSDSLHSKLSENGFDTNFINNILKKYNFKNTINLKDVDSVFATINFDYTPIVVTYPAYDNRGISNKLRNDFFASNILHELSAIISSAKKEITIISPYVEENGIIFFEDILKRKIQKGVVINLVLREYNENTTRMNNLSCWIKDNMEGFNNFRLYNYHYTSEEGRIESTCHAKIVSVDGHIAYVGSADIRERAFKLNFEMGTINTGYVGRCISLICEEIVNASERIPLGV